MQITDLQIIKATMSNMEALVALFLSYLDFYKRQARTAEAEAFLRSRFEADESVVFLAMAGAEAVGFVQLYPTFSSLSLRRLWILSDLYVVEPTRRCGIAKALIRRAQKLALETHSEGLVLETAVSNTAAQRLYEQLGWHRDQDFYRYYLQLNHAPD
jgi:ribosomal protein S18 acetylase RimI-like enzyme